jgi:hypothetical protein
VLKNNFNIFCIIPPQIGQPGLRHFARNDDPADIWYPGLLRFARNDDFAG